jgi:hypothetical protein
MDMAQSHTINEHCTFHDKTGKFTCSSETHLDLDIYCQSRYVVVYLVLIIQALSGQFH